VLADGQQGVIVVVAIAGQGAPAGEAEELEAGGKVAAAVAGTLN
jgi:hypothetical protein